MSTTDLVQRDPAQDAAYGLIQAEEVFTPARREAIAQFLEIEADSPALVPYLAVCARYGLDPIMGQVWLIPQKIKGKDGQPDRERLRPTAGRDGYLAIARRQSDYGGLAGDVVHARDRFQVRLRRPEDPEGIPEAGGGRVIVHEYPELSEVIAEERANPDAAERRFDPATYRGPILGAWAVCYPRGREPVYYFASIREHGKTWESRDGNRRGWSGAWEYTSTMALKAAQSYVLRIAYGITGMVPADEVREDPPGAAERIEWDPADVLPEELSGMAEEFRGAVQNSWAVDPNLWNRSKLEMYGSSLRSAEDVMHLLNRIEEETEREQEVRATEGEEVVDAEVVPEDRLSEEEENQLEHQLADVEAALQDAEGDQAAELEAERAQLLERLGRDS